jgi:hypothetical protein
LITNSTKGKHASQQTQPLPHKKGQKPHPKTNAKLGIDFWHAVEFSSVGHAPPHDFRHDPGQPLKLISPSPADPNRFVILR